MYYKIHNFIFYIYIVYVSIYILYILYIKHMLFTIFHSFALYIYLLAYIFTSISALCCSNILNLLRLWPVNPGL